MVSMRKHQLMEVIRAFVNNLESNELCSINLLERINLYLQESKSTLGHYFRIDGSGMVYIMEKTTKSKNEDDDEEEDEDDFIAIKISNTFVLPIRDKILYYPEFVERHLDVICLMEGVWSPTISLTPSKLRSDKDWMRNELGFKSLIYDNSYSKISEYINYLCPFVPTVHEYMYIGWSKSHRGINITGSGEE